MPQQCTECGVEQTKRGMCWDDGKCAKCYYGESMTDVRKAIIVG